MSERPRIHRARQLFTTVALLSVLWAPLANASTTFLVVLVTDYGYQGNCDTCHTTLVGGAGTATKPLGQTLQGFGLVGMAPDADVRAAFSQLVTSDSDNDGFSDDEELRQQGDPNDAAVGPGGNVIEVPTYGCLSVSRAPASGSSLGLLCAGLVALTLSSSLLRRWRR